MKKVIFTHGLPGSGKNFLADKLQKKAIKDGFTSVIVCTDDFFMVDGQYKWDFNFLSAGHEWCFGQFALAMFRETNIIIVANTNLQAWTLNKYIDLSVKIGYEWSIKEPTTDWVYSPEECAKRNTHNVPLATIEKMHKARESVKDMEKELRARFKC